MKHFFVALLFLPLMSFNTHKFYVSNTIIEYSAQNQSYGITVKMFTDDLENVIAQNSAVVSSGDGFADELVGELHRFSAIGHAEVEVAEEMDLLAGQHLARRSA